jgi:hypothetical protein
VPPALYIRHILRPRHVANAPPVAGCRRHPPRRFVSSSSAALVTPLGSAFLHRSVFVSTTTNLYIRTLLERGRAVVNFKHSSTRYTRGSFDAVTSSHYLCSTSRSSEHSLSKVIGTRWTIYENLIVIRVHDGLNTPAYGKPPHPLYHS